jgi:hypothetical protein
LAAATVGTSRAVELSVEDEAAVLLSKAVQDKKVSSLVCVASEILVVRSNPRRV